jgi:hypothetical protein
MRFCKSLQLFIFLVVFAFLALGQVGNGTITGTVTDPVGAVVPGATVEARNVATGVVFPAVSTSTGNYTIPDLPVGSYEVSVKVQGFKTYTHTNLALAAAGIIREDVTLQVGNATEAVTVTAEASLLKTETAELSHNVSIDQMNDLPLLGVGTSNSGTSGVRNPYNVLQTIPGVSNYASSGQFTLNGLGGNMTETMRVEGQDSTSRLFGTYDYTQMGQPSADSIQEIAFQTSNYAAEYGQAGSAVINMTMKSGTNQYHGSGFDYFVNEDLYAGDPFTVSAGPLGGNGGKLRPRQRRNDFGGTLGGPIFIPKVYNGRNKSFFFFNYEQFLETTQYSLTDTVPVPAYLAGDFSGISPNGNCSLCVAQGIPTGALGTNQVDALGRPLFANEIYDPLTRGVNPTNNLGYANPFPNNVIPANRIDPVAAKIQALLPTAQNPNLLLNNYGAHIQGNRYTAIPSIKIDHNLSDKDKLSFFWSRINTESQISSPLGGADGLPQEIGAYRGTFIPTYTTRLNYDRTLSPTLLLHLGAGFYHTQFFDHAPFLNFDPASVGLSGFVIHRQFPQITGMCVAATAPATGCVGYGGMQNLGESIQTLNYEEKPSFTANLTWIRGSHTYKVGAELYLEQVYNGNFSTVILATGLNATSQPFTPTGSLNNFTQGFGYASFLLGDFGTTSALTGATTSTTQAPQENYRQGQQAWGVFLQDSWKVTRKMTLDYGIRWDLATPYHEQYGRLGQFDPTTPNANAGGHPGATLYANTCNCTFYQPTYPYGIGPRIGLAYQIDPKTVLRAGWGVNYQFVGATAGGIVAANGAYPLSGINSFVNIETPGAIVAPSWPVTDPNRYPVIGTVGGAAGTVPVMPDANQNRPPRINQWSVGLQREVSRNFIVEASYVANRGVWEQGAAFGGSGPLGFLSQISPARFAQFGLYPYPGTGPAGYAYKPTGLTCVAGNDCDRALLSQSINSTAVVQKLNSIGISNISPYSGFPGTNSLLSALYPFPQFGALAPTGSATGNSKYDSLQVKVTKRLSHGLQAGGAYTFARGFVRPTRQDFFNPNSNPWQLQQIPPQTLTFNATYTVPKAAFLPKYANQVTKDWQVGFYATYQSGTFLTPPVSPTLNQLSSEDIRNPGVPLYLKDINNIHSYNPYTDIVLNPAAWTACPTNATCAATSTLYTDFKAPRRPLENANIGRNFRIKERMNLQIRGEFVNIFNRTLMPNPITTNPQNAPQKNGSIYTGGFGVINAYAAPGSIPTTAVSPVLFPRTGTIIARFTF